MIIFSNIQLLRGCKPLLDQATATIRPKNKIGLVGKNGCGKSSLLALIKNELTLDAGNFSIPAEWQIAWVAQETPALKRAAIEYVIDGDHEYRELQEQLILAEKINDGHKQANIHEKIETIGGYTIYSRAAELLNGLGFSQEQMQWNLTQFSGGWRMRLNLAQALICRSDLLLLDEPTNHLDLDAVIWLERWLKNYPGTMIIISHDRDFLDPLIDHIIHIENQTFNEYTGNYSDFEVQRAERLNQQQAIYQKQQLQIEHMQSYIERFRYKASKARQAQSRIKALEKMELALPAQLDNPFTFKFRKPTSLPTPILNMEKVSIGYCPETNILDKISLNLVPGSRIGLLGKNGAGKSTLIKLLANKLTPKSGKFVYSQGVKIGYFAQHQLEALYPDDSPLKHMQRLAPKSLEQELRNYLGSFDFIGDKALEPIGPFSGGEKARLALALVVWEKPNLLLLDEPTNHLDLDMRQALTFALQAFEGAMVVVSHDRYLLKTTTDELYLVDNKKVEPFAGDLGDYYKWLVEQNKNSKNEASTKTLKEKTNNAATRKEQKRLEAEKRKLLAPIRKELKSLETKIDKINLELTAIEQKLLDNSLYEQSQKDLLQSILNQQISFKKDLEVSEERWFELTEKLEGAD